MALTKKPKLKLYCRQGKTFRHSFYFQDEYGNYANLSGYTARMEIRTAFPDSDSTSGDDDVLVTLTTSNGGLTIETKKLSVYISDSDTADFPEGSYFYEPELIAPSGDIIDFIAPSSFVVLPEVTI